MNTEIFQSWDIGSDLKICHIKKFDESFNDLVRKFFDHAYPILRWREFLSAEDKEAVDKLNSNLKQRERIDIGILDGEKLIGWSYGWQGGFESASYYMANSCVLPEYRNRGLYTQMLNKVIEISKEKSFHTITSRHLASNNAVLIAKLKAGFKITGIELSEVHGNLIHLTHFNNDLRADTFDVRSGMAKPERDIIKNLYL